MVPMQLQAILHYTTSKIALKSISPVTSSSSASVTIPSLSGLPDLVYDKEWDMIMIDAPRGYFSEAPGRMGAIYSAARVEKSYAEEFLYRKYLKDGAGRLWHFEIPSARNVIGDSFC
ncbi:hypothetical protein R6Q59_014230 [Mikania micrantha]